MKFRLKGTTEDIEMTNLDELTGYVRATFKFRLGLEVASDDVRTKRELSTFLMPEGWRELHAVTVQWYGLVGYVDDDGQGCYL